MSDETYGPEQGPTGVVSSTTCVTRGLTWRTLVALASEGGWRRQVLMRNEEGSENDERRRRGGKGETGDVAER